MSNRWTYDDNDARGYCQQIIEMLELAEKERKVMMGGLTDILKHMKIEGTYYDMENEI